MLFESRILFMENSDVFSTGKVYWMHTMWIMLHRCNRLSERVFQHCIADWHTQIVKVYFDTSTVIKTTHCSIFHVRILCSVSRYYFDSFSGSCFLEFSLQVFVMSGNFTGISIGNSQFNTFFWIHDNCENNRGLTTAFAVQTRTSNLWTRKYSYFSICQQSIKSKRWLFLLTTKCTVMCKKMCRCFGFLNCFHKLHLWWILFVLDKVHLLDKLYNDIVS